MKCRSCDGKGAVRYQWPSSKAIPCYWFVKGAGFCLDCDGTGEVDRIASTPGKRGRPTKENDNDDNG